jgi:serine/threonine-protein kinase
LITTVAAPVVHGFGLLAEAGANVARAQAEDERKRQQQLSESQVRNNLAAGGRKILAEIVIHLFNRIEKEAPMARRAASGSGVSLGAGTLEFSVGSDRAAAMTPALGPGAFPRSRWDVVASDEVRIRQIGRAYLWSSSLWYCRLPGIQEYRWYETSYFAAFGGGDVFAPYSLCDRIQDADLAAAPIMHVHQVAFGPVAIDDESEEEFIERYSALLALAANGRLGHPSGLPLRESFWRKPFMV